MIKLIRTIANQLIIGEVSENEKTLIIQQPYDVIPNVDGIKMFPLDSAIIGKELEFAEIHKSNTIYVVEPAETLKDAYINALSPIENPTKQLII